MQVTKKNGIQHEGNIINQMLFRYLPYWPLFIVLLLLGVAAAYTYIRYAIPVFEARAAIMIKDERKGSDDSKVLEALNVFGSKKTVENEIQIIKSRKLLKEVVINLRLYSPTYEEGKVNTTPAFLKSPVDIEIKNPDSMVEAEKVYFNFDKNRQLVLINSKEYPINQWVGSPWGTIRFVPNKYFKESIDPKPLYFALVDPKKVVSFLDEQLTISPSNKMSTVINMTVKDPVPRRGELILNELIKQYDRAAVNDKNALARNTLDFLEKKLMAVKTDVDSVERGIQRFKTTNNVIDLNAQGQQYLGSVGTSDKEVGTIDLRLVVLKEVEAYVRSRGQNAGIVPSTAGLDDASLTLLLNKLYESQAKYEKLRATTGENSPTMKALADEINTLRPQLLENIGSQRSNLIAQKNNLTSTTNKYSSLLRSMPEKDRRLVEISRDWAVKKNNYEMLLQRKDEAELSFNAAVADSRLVDEAEAGSLPVSPNKLLVYLIAILGGITVAVIVVAVKEGLNKNILFRSEIENYTNVPILGEVIQDNGGQGVVIAHDKKNFIAEQFRQIRTSLSYLGVSSRKKKILVTSSISGEGKSFISANLAISLALTDKKVVLLEIDLRKPKLSEIFGLKSNAAGISNYLIGEKEADEIIKRTSVNPNLFIISAGPIPPNPSELILNGKIQELLAYLENAFDYVVIDTAPVSPVTDAYLLSQFCDATLYVVRHGYTPRIYLQLLDENNKIRGLKNLALIFNGVKARGIGKGGYGNGYGYGYGVGYDDEDVETGAKKSKSIFNKVYK